MIGYLVVIGIVPFLLLAIAILRTAANRKLACCFEGEAEVHCKARL